MIWQIIGLKCTEIVELESFETLPEKDLQPWEKGRCKSSCCDVPFGFPPLCTWSWIPHPHIHHAFRACQCRMNLCYQVSSIITLFQLCQCLYTFFSGTAQQQSIIRKARSVFDLPWANQSPLSERNNFHQTHPPLVTDPAFRADL